MSVMIKGMGMPNGCYDCPILQSCDGCFDFECPFNSYLLWHNAEDVIRYRPDSCPLVEIPTPHGRLIDADANVGSYVETWTCNCSEFGTQRVMAVDDLKYLSIIIEAEVS